MKAFGDSTVSLPFASAQPARERRSKKENILRRLSLGKPRASFNVDRLQGASDLLHDAPSGEVLELAPLGVTHQELGDVVLLRVLDENLGDLPFEALGLDAEALGEGEIALQDLALGLVHAGLLDVDADDLAAQALAHAPALADQAQGASIG